ncbi:c-type cytochrome [Vibrio viridaestus]|uniref:Cytochrome c n=1 Tax=Vibrio viridaestus TaxID=2487322 RepID=A0A3N9TI52_9VIBR|nr:cytochrome c [Vibrio viridaestus]RQW63957.1 cytochrome c [Vibrio viridaestus]
MIGRFFSVCALFLSLGAMAADMSAIAQKAAVCGACHGRDGVATIDGYPNLKGQNEKYLVSSLKAYRDNKRLGPMATLMSAQSSRLSDEDIEALAAYYANMK